MKKSYNPISDVRNETVDLTKRLFRNISDAVHNLDDIRGRANCVDNLFTRVANTQRVRLKDCCERLIFCDKSRFGRKAEELLWRKGYYEVISAAKRLKKGNSLGWMPEEAALVHHHVLAGIGQYRHLLSRLQLECGIDLRGIVDNPVLYLDEGLKKGKSNAVSVNGRNKTASITSCNHNSIEGSNNVDWAVNVAHRCLIYLGDLCRYLLDLQPGWDYGLPARYYTQALMLKPDAGMPFNQLGTLAGTHNYSLEAVYYYMRCMCCPQSFEGAEGNLLHALDKTARWLESGGRASGVESVSSVSRLIARLLYLTRVWFCSRTSLLPLHKVCDELLIDLPKCLFEINEAIELDAANAAQQLEIDDIDVLVMKRSHLNEQPTYLSEDMLFKMIVILLMCMQHLEKKGSEEFMRVVALLLAVISQLLQQALEQLEKVLPPPTLPLLPTSPFTTNGISKRRRRRRWRRRRGSSEGSSDLSEGDDVVYVSSTDSDISEEELVFDEHNSDDSDAEDEVILNGKTAGENGVTDNTFSAAGKGDMNCNPATSSSEFNSIQRPATLWSSLDKANDTFIHVHNLMQQGYLLQTIKICFDWLASNMDVLKSCSQGCKPLVNRTATFLNHLNKVPMPSIIKTEKPTVVTSSVTISPVQPHNSATSEVNDCNTKNDKNINNNELSKHNCNYALEIDEEIEQLPLPEDLSLRGLPIFSWAHSKLIWNKLPSKRLSNEQESYLRICKLMKLGVKMANQKETTSLLFDSEKDWFSVENGEGQVTTINPTETGANVTNLKINTMFNPGPAAIMNTANSTDSQSKQEGVTMKQDKLMQDMGQLWLRAEVKELETKVKKTATHLPPYLVLDCDALTLHCPLVKQLAASRKFIILIPTVVVSALDEQKRSSGRVRDTIRWLESQFRHGNRFLRAQRANEHLPLPLIKYPKKKDKEAWLFFQVVECCHFLNSQGGGKDTGLVTLLTGSPTLLTCSNTSGFSPLGIVNSAGISIEHIESFHGKWKSSYKSHG